MLQGVPKPLTYSLKFSKRAVKWRPVQNQGALVRMKHLTLWVPGPQTDARHTHSTVGTTVTIQAKRQLSTEGLSVRFLFVCVGTADGTWASHVPGKRQIIPRPSALSQRNKNRSVSPTLLLCIRLGSFTLDKGSLSIRLQHRRTLDEVSLPSYLHIPGGRKGLYYHLHFQRPRK